MSLISKTTLVGLVAWMALGLAGCVVIDGGGNDCAPFEQCNLSCTGGDCFLTCDEGSICDASCTGGNCEMVCERDASCDFSCVGGDCHVLCHATADCDISCVGGDCVLEHFGDPDEGDRPVKRPADDDQPAETPAETPADAPTGDRL